VAKAILRDRGDASRLRIRPVAGGVEVYTSEDVARPLFRIRDGAEGMEVRLVGSEEITLVIDRVEELYSFSDLVLRAAGEREQARRRLRSFTDVR
jgi:hypothetical protein